MKNKRTLTMLVTLIAFFSAHAKSPDSACGISLKAFDLHCNECYEKSELNIAKFISSSESTPFSTEFDRRVVVVVSGKELVMERPKAEPPMSDQILKRMASKSKRKYKGWLLSTEQILYSAQGQIPGFTIDCTVAGKLFKQEYITVSECYPLERKKMFLQILQDGVLGG